MVRAYQSVDKVCAHDRYEYIAELKAFETVEIDKMNGVPVSFATWMLLGCGAGVVWIVYRNRKSDGARRQATVEINRRKKAVGRPLAGTRTLTDLKRNDQMERERFGRPVKTHRKFPAVDDSNDSGICTDKKFFIGENTPSKLVNSASSSNRSMNDTPSLDISDREQLDDFARKSRASPVFVGQSGAHPIPVEPRTEGEKPTNTVSKTVADVYENLGESDGEDRGVVNAALEGRMSFRGATTRQYIPEEEDDTEADELEQVFQQHDGLKLAEPSSANVSAVIVECPASADSVSRPSVPDEKVVELEEFRQLVEQQGEFGSSGQLSSEFHQIFPLDGLESNGQASSNSGDESVDFTTSVHGETRQSVSKEEDETETDGLHQLFSQDGLGSSVQASSTGADDAVDYTTSDHSQIRQSVPGQEAETESGEFQQIFTHGVLDSSEQAFSTATDESVDFSTSVHSDTRQSAPEEEEDKLESEEIQETLPQNVLNSSGQAFRTGTDESVDFTTSVHSDTRQSVPEEEEDKTELEEIQQTLPQNVLNSSGQAFSTGTDESADFTTSVHSDTRQSVPEEKEDKTELEEIQQNLPQNVLDSSGQALSTGAEESVGFMTSYLSDTHQSIPEEEDEAETKGSHHQYHAEFDSSGQSSSGVESYSGSLLSSNELSYWADESDVEPFSGVDEKLSAIPVDENTNNLSRSLDNSVEDMLEKGTEEDPEKRKSHIEVGPDLSVSDLENSDSTVEGIEADLDVKNKRNSGVKRVHFTEESPDLENTAIKMEELLASAPGVTLLAEEPSADLVADDEIELLQRHRVRRIELLAKLQQTSERTMMPEDTNLRIMPETMSESTKEILPTSNAEHAELTQDRTQNQSYPQSGQELVGIVKQRRQDRAILFERLGQAVSSREFGLQAPPDAAEGADEEQDVETGEKSQAPGALSSLQVPSPGEIRKELDLTKARPVIPAANTHNMLEEETRLIQSHREKRTLMLAELQQKAERTKQQNETDQIEMQSKAKLELRKGIKNKGVELTEDQIGLQSYSQTPEQLVGILKDHRERRATLLQRMVQSSDMKGPASDGTVGGNEAEGGIETKRRSVKRRNLFSLKSAGLGDTNPEEGIELIPTHVEKRVALMDKLRWATGRIKGYKQKPESSF